MTMAKNSMYKEPSNYFPPDLMRELMEDGKKNIKKNQKKSNDSKKTGTNKKGKK